MSNLYRRVTNNPDAPVATSRYVKVEPVGFLERRAPTSYSDASVESVRWIIRGPKEPGRYAIVKVDDDE